MDDENMTSPNLQEMILEYAWTHKMKDLQEVVDTSLWMEAKQQYYSLKEPWRLRVATAQAYSIIKNRDVGRYERVISFLEASYRLLPTLVVAIKHMKIMFGLKTLVIMWMLKQGQGLVPIVVKILQFFPSKLPQYQDHCSNKEIFLMQKNHLDFRLFAQSLALDKMKLEDYIKNELEEQYGEHYTQKVEDRLLHYVHELEMMLPRDTYIDQILRQEHKVSHEHKDILEIIAQGSTAIASSLRMLLQWGDKSCCPLKFSSKPAVAAVVEPVALPEPDVNSISFGAPPRSETAKAPVMAREDALCRHLSQDSPLLFPMEQQEHSGGVGDGEDLTPSDLIPCDLIQKPSSRQTSCLSPASAQGPGPTLSMHNPCPTRSVQPLCPPGVRPGSPRAGATNTSHHIMAPSTTPCTSVPECSASHEAAASSPPKPLAPSYSSDVKHRLTVGLLPDGAHSQFAPSISPDAVKPQLAPAVALPVSEQYQPALASTLPAHYQQTVSGSDPPSVRSLTPGHTAAPSPGPSRCVAAPERGCHLSGSPTQTPASPHHAPPGSSKDSSEVSALPPSSDLHSVSLTSTCAARATPCTELPPGSRPALAAAVSTGSDGPPPSVSARVPPRAPTQSLPQPYVRLTRLHPLRYLRETGRRAPPSTETPLVEKQALGDPHDEGGGEEEEEEEEEGEGGVKFLYFDPNLLFSGDESSCSDSGASEDLDYMPSRSHQKKQVPNMSPDM
ncbi:unnamed protein product [Boreogadus saida]